MLHPRDDTQEAAAFLGILYAEDFDNPPEPAPEGEPASLTQAHVDLACAEAVATARAEWHQSHQRQHAVILGTITAAIVDMRAQSETAALAAAEGTVTTMLAMLAGALPRLCSEHGPAEIRALVARLLPHLRAEPRVTIRVHADLVADIEASLADLEHETAGNITVVAANLPSGDVKVTWDSGSLVRDSSQIHQAMLDALALLGLQQPIETSPKRSMAHAE